MLIDSNYWLTWYKGLYDPDAETPPWTKSLVGTVGYDKTQGIVTLTDTDNLTGLRYSLDPGSLSNSAGTILEARMRVIASSSGPDTGALLSISDGLCQFRLWLRADGLNLQDQANEAVDMTVWRYVRLVATWIDASVYVDDNLIQRGHLNALTDKQEITFGTVPDYGFATTQWHLVRARRMQTYEGIKEVGWLVTIGPYCSAIEDLPIGSAVTMSVTHPDGTDFAWAEMPIFTATDGTTLESKGVLVRALCDTDGKGFEVEFYNDSYGGDTGYYGVTHVGYCWSRRGLVEV